MKRLFQKLRSQTGSLELPGGLLGALLIAFVAVIVYVVLFQGR